MEQPSTTASCNIKCPDGNFRLYAAEAKAAAAKPRVRPGGTCQPSLADLLSGAMEGLEDELPAVASTPPAEQSPPPAVTWRPPPQLSSRFVTKGAVAEGTGSAGLTQQSEDVAVPSLMSSAVPGAAASLRDLQASWPGLKIFS